MPHDLIEYDDVYAFHPGYYISDIIDDRKASHSGFARRMGMSSKELCSLLDGQIPVTKQIAKRLSSVTGMSIDVWLNLQNEYDARISEIERLKKDKR